MEKKDHYIEIFMGTDYKIRNWGTIGELKNKLEEIIKDLPSDNDLKISEIHAHNWQLGYTLSEGIPQ